MKYKELSAKSTADDSQAPYISSFHQALSATAMSKDMSQVSVTLFPSFQHLKNYSLDSLFMKQSENMSYCFKNYL